MQPKINIEIFGSAVEQESFNIILKRISLVIYTRKMIHCVSQESSLFLEFIMEKNYG